MTYTQLVRFQVVQDTMVHLGDRMGMALWLWSKPLDTVSWCWLDVRERIQLRGDDGVVIPTCPRVDTVLLSLLVLLMFLIAAVPAVIYPTIGIKYFVVIFNVTLASLLGATFAFDILSSKYRSVHVEPGVDI
jgi:hypothetical protein